MANIKDFIKKIGNETVSLEEQQQALAAVEQTIVEAKAKREESIGKNVDLVISALKKIESDLNTKLIELNNTPAKQGVAGPKGEKGRDGRDGKDGYKGQNGKDGVDGVDGKDGTDGISVTDAKVDFDGSLVITLSDGREIDAGTVVSLDVAKNIHSVQTGGTGSTSQAVLDAIAAIQATIATYGTMAEQNANAVAITGGTINGTTVGATTATTGAFTTLTSTGGAVNGTIGATTPAAGTFTTITGQTEVLKGTGSNLIQQSQALATSPWSTANGLTVTNNAATAPNGTTTASKLAEPATTTNYFACVQNPTTVAPSAIYTHSFYAKSAERTQAYIYNTVSTYTVYFDLSAGTVLSGSGANYISSSITSVGSGWYRCSVTFTASTSANPFYTLIGPAVGGTFSYSSTLGYGILVWGVQLEIGSTANTYIPTTTTAIYGTPTISFSGVSEIGLLSNGALYLQPAGTGALQAQATTSTTAGGNARGANAVDWQTIRYNAVHVASSSQAVITGGNSNTASGTRSFVGSGYNNTASGTDSVLGGGFINTTSGVYASVVSGYANTASGYYGFVGNGFTNSTTSNSAVTTQSGTMNGTTAVTLSGSNANIKVGQLITGTSISFPDTYVAAISGTALTLSKVASGSSTSTLSFFTPHGVVVGGGNNQATGSYSFIGGGGDAGTAANRNVASGDWSVVAGGFKNVASGVYSFVGGGATNTASSIGSVVCGGGAYATGGFVANSASSLSSFVGAGVGNTASGSYSFISAGTFGNTRGIDSYHVFPANNNAFGISAQGVSQSGLLLLARQTTDATPTALASNTVAAGTTNQVILPNNSAYFFTGEVVSGITGGGNTKGWTIEGVIKRGANAASTALVGTPTVTSLYGDAGAATWAIAITADTTNGGIRVTFTGQAATTIRTVCQIRTTEMTY